MIFFFLPIGIFKRELNLLALLHLCIFLLISIFLLLFLEQFSSFWNNFIPFRLILLFLEQLGLLSLSRLSSILRAFRAFQLFGPNLKFSNIFLKKYLNSFYRPLRFGNHDRLPDPDDCQKFYSCLRDGQPRLGVCPRKTVFNNATGLCDDPNTVPGW